MGRIQNYNEKKLRELILYIAAKSDGDPNFGATKLNKILFFADFEAFVQIGKPITGATYQRLPHGPAPRPLLPLKRQMVEEHDVVEREHSVFSQYTQKRIVPLRDPDLSGFTANEIAIVDATLEALRSNNAKEVSDISHQMDGWKLATNGEDIPYQTAILDDEPLELTAEHLELAAQVADMINKEAA